MPPVADTLAVSFGTQPAHIVMPLAMESDTPRMVGPVAMIAHVSPVPRAPLETPVDDDVRPHPHIGLAAVSVVLAGSVTHRDNLGNVQECAEGSVAITLAGRGIVHSERVDRLRAVGGQFGLIQILLALPEASEDVAPAFHYVAPAAVPVQEAAGLTVRQLLGPGSATPELPTPAVVLDVELGAGSSLTLPDLPERAVYLMSGEVEIGGDAVGPHQRAVVEPGPALVEAREASRFLVFGGEPIGPRWFWWNYIHSDLEAVTRAREAWRAGEVPLPPGDTESFTPAPPDDGRPLRRLNG